MTVAVAVPYFGCPDLIERAVRSILGQTVRDLVCVVVGDGQEPPLSKVRDSRLVVLTMPVNRGPYFAQQVVLEASPFELYAPHGADDWSDPEHLERLLRLGGDAALTGAVWWHQGSRVSVHRGAYEVGMFKRDRLLALGGHNPAERIGQDTLMIRLLRLTGTVGMTTQPTYHRLKRRGSLTTAPATRRGSPARNEMRARNRAIFRKARELRDPAKIRAFRERRVPVELKEEVAEQAARLRAMLA